MRDLLVLGGLGVDIRVRVPSLPLPDVDSTTVPPIDLRLGNTGAGVALAAHALGLRVGVVDSVGSDPLGEIVRAALSRTTIEPVLLADPRGTRRSVNLVGPNGRRAALYDPRSSWSGPPPITPERLADLVRSASHVHVSIMDWMRELLPVLTDAVVSTDLHDWDGVNDYHRPFLAAADVVFLSGTALGDRVEQVAREIFAVGRPSR